MPPQTAISPPVGTYALIFYSHWGNASHWGLVPDPSERRSGKKAVKIREIRAKI